MWTIFIPCMSKVRQGRSSLCRQRISTAGPNCFFFSLFLKRRGFFFFFDCCTQLSRAVGAAFYPIITFHMSCFPSQIKHLLVVLQHTQSAISKQLSVEELAGKPRWTSQTLHHIQICVNIHYHQTWLELLHKWKEICVCVKIRGWGAFIFPYGSFFLFLFHCQ